MEVRRVENISKIVKDIRKRIPKIKRKSLVNPPKDSTSFKEILRNIINKKK